MSRTNVEWVLVVRYLLSQHKATYGRLKDNTYTKDYIQLSRDPGFLADISALFSDGDKPASVVPLRYKWPADQAPGSLIFRSADRPHLSWETWRGAPAPWKMALEPREDAAETIPGDPSHQDPTKATEEFRSLKSKGGGQPYLIAVKLYGEPRTLHLRAYLDNPSNKYSWADTSLLPPEIRALIERTSDQSALAWARFSNSGRLTFDPARNHDTWASARDLSEIPLREKLISPPLNGGPHASDSAIVAEMLETTDDLVEQFRQQIDEHDFSVDDQYANSKTRGSAQRAFAERVKKNYKWECAVTGISTRAFLVAAHIVPWSQDKNIRLDPSNGICLSLLIDRAFEEGHIFITDDFRIVVNKDRIASDIRLQEALGSYDGKKLKLPERDPPMVEYLRRRRAAPTAPS